jgi:hypothetical protein
VVLVVVVVLAHSRCLRFDPDADPLLAQAPENATFETLSDGPFRLPLTPTTLTLTPAGSQALKLPPNTRLKLDLKSMSPEGRLL